MGRGAGGFQARHPCAGRRRGLAAAVLEDGHGHGQDLGHGHDRGLADAECRHLSQGARALLEGHLRGGARADGERALAGALSGQSVERLRRVQPVSIRGHAPEAEPGGAAGRELAHADAAEGSGSQRGQEGRRERPRLRAPGVKEAGRCQGSGGHQRRGPPRVPCAGR